MVGVASGYGARWGILAESRHDLIAAPHSGAGCLTRYLPSI